MLSVAKMNLNRLPVGKASATISTMKQATSVRVAFRCLIAMVVAVSMVQTASALNAWRVWTGGDGVAGGSGVWTADSLTWSTADSGGGTQVSQYRDKLKFPDDLGDPGAAATITVGDSVEIEGTVYFTARQLTLDGTGPITVSNGLAVTVYPQASTTINCPIQLLNSNMNIAVKMDNKDEPSNTFESACLTINSNVTVPRIILYCGTLILNGDVTITASNGAIGSYQAQAGAFFGHLYLNGRCTGAAGSVISQDSIISGTGTIELQSGRTVAVYGRMQPGGVDEPGTLTVTSTGNAGYASFYEGSELDFRVDLDADKADKLVLGNNSHLQSLVGNKVTDDIATIRICVTGKTTTPRTYQLFDVAQGCKGSRFLYVIEKDASCKADVTFDEPTGVLTVTPAKPKGLMLILR